MEILKKIARKILADEIENYKPLADILKERNIELRGELAELENKYRNSTDELSKIKAELEKSEELKKENEILRKYYDLDKELSDEIKAKIHIDLEINRLKDEMIKMLAMQRQQPIYYMPPSYPFGRGF